MYREQQVPSEEWQRLHVQLLHNVGMEGIQTAIWLNGGAAVAVLGFVGTHAVEAGKAAMGLDIARAKMALLGFGIGVFIAACTYLVSYMLQPSFIQDRTRARQDHMRWICTAMILSSLALFLAGMALTANAVFPP